MTLKDPESITGQSDQEIFNARLPARSVSAKAGVFWQASAHEFDPTTSAGMHLIWTFTCHGISELVNSGQNQVKIQYYPHLLDRRP